MSERRISGRALVIVSAVIVVAAVAFVMSTQRRRPTWPSALTIGTSSNASTGVELSFEAAPSVAARLVVTDLAGRSLAPIRSFERDGGRLRIVVPPRSLASHQGEARATAFAGNEASVVAAANEIEAALRLGPLGEDEMSAITQRHGLSRAVTPLP